MSKKALLAAAISTFVLLAAHNSPAQTVPDLNNPPPPAVTPHRSDDGDIEHASGHENAEHESSEHESPEHESNEHESPEHESSEHESPEHESPEHESSEHESPDTDNSGHGSSDVDLPEDHHHGRD